MGLKTVPEELVKELTRAMVVSSSCSARRPEAEGIVGDKAPAVEIFMWMGPEIGLGLGLIISEDQVVGKMMEEIKFMVRRISDHRSSFAGRAADQLAILVIAVMVSFLVSNTMDMVIIQ